MSGKRVERAYSRRNFHALLSRKRGERIVVPPCRLTLTVSAMDKNSVRLAIAASAELDVYWEEIWRQRCLQLSGTPNLFSDRAGSIPSTVQQGENHDPA